MRSAAENYYKASSERIKDAYLLHTTGRYSFAMYASGLAVECLLRAFRVLSDPSFDARHDLWLLWKKTPLSKVRYKKSSKRIFALMGEVSVRWQNSYRFVSHDEICSLLKKSGRDRGIQGDFLKYNSKKLYEAAREIVQLGGLQWSQLKKE